MNEPMSRTRAAQLVAFLVAVLGPLPRTKLVKLVYLVDEYWARLKGHTLTGFSYYYDHHGPNSVSLVNVAKTLDGSELRIEERHGPKGPWFAYLQGPRPIQVSFDVDELEVITEVIDAYGSLTVNEIIAASKATAPFERRPEHGDKLVLADSTKSAKERLARLRQQVAGYVPGSQAGLPLGPQQVTGELDRRQRQAVMTSD